MLKSILKWLSVDKLLEAVLEEFNLVFLVEAIIAFFSRLKDERVDNKTLYEITLAAAARAETLHPKGHGFEKYKMVFEGVAAEGKHWIKEEVDDVGDAFGAWIDDMIQVVHAKIEKVISAHGPAILGSMSARLDSFPNAAAKVKVE